MFGLIDATLEKKFPLSSVEVKCNVNNLLVSCTAEFVYKNDSDNNTEALFSFPLHGNCSVYSFAAIISGRKIEGVCKEISEARNMYKAATEAGHKTAIIERNTSMTDVFKCRIGNIPKYSEARILIKFVMELHLSLSKGELDVDRFELCLPLVLRPRYTPSNYTGDVDVYYVNNVYEYKFEATVAGTKEIKVIFSNNYTLKTTFSNAAHTCAQVNLESKYDGTHDFDIFVDFVKIRTPSVIYEFGTSSNNFKGKKMNGTFYKNDVAMLNFLPEFPKESEIRQKVEVIFVVDRSGSMSGSNIQHAKECLLIFLKSLPINCKFQIYGFGSSFDKVFPQPQIYDERSIETALTYQKNIEADFGGTELMNPLKDLLMGSLADDYKRVVFLLTDGDVGNQDEVFKLVREHNHSSRLFTVGIGHGVSTSLVEKVAESGLGKSVFVRDSNTLSASVIELLDIALNCQQLVDLKVEWDCPKNINVVMVPTNPKPIFSNYFLTVLCMIDGLKEGGSIICNVSGKLNKIPMKWSLEVKSKDGINDDEFRVHRLLAKYKIDEMTPKIQDDGNEDLLNELIQLSLDVNMVTDYTTFVAIDPDVPDRGLLMDENEYMFSMDRNMVQCAAYDVVDSSRVCYDDCGVIDNDEEEFCLGAEEENVNKIMEVEREQVNVDIVLYLAEKQHILGFWRFDEGLIRHLGLDLIKVKSQKPASAKEEVWITAIICEYLIGRFSSKEKEWRLFAKKAKEWIESDMVNMAAVNEVMLKAREVI